MQITSRLPSRVPPKPRVQEPEDFLTPKEMVRVGAAVVGAAAGAWAGVANGWFAGVLGGASATIPCGIGGSILASTIGEKVFHTSESTTAGLALAGGAAGLLGGAVGGYLVGARMNNPVVAIGLGMMGAATALIGHLRD